MRTLLFAALPLILLAGCASSNNNQPYGLTGDQRTLDQDNMGRGYDDGALGPGSSDPSIRHGVPGDTRTNSSPSMSSPNSIDATSR